MNRFSARFTFRNATSASLCGLLIIAFVGFFMALPQSAAAVATFTVNSTLDLPDLNPGDGICNAGVAGCTLRAAVMEANASAGPDTITLPAGTYTLSITPSDDEFNFDGARDDIGDLDVLNDDLTINGAGAATTIIDGGGIDRIFDVNNFSAFGAGVNFTLNGVTLRNGNAPTSPEGYRQPGGAIQFDGSGATPTLSINNCKITNNTAAGIGGGVLTLFGSMVVSGSEFSSNKSLNGSGGGILFDAGAASGSRSLQVSTSTFSQNQTPNGTFGNGGAISTGGNANITIENNSFSGNTAGANGGAVSADAFLITNTKAINKNKFENNSAAQGGALFNRNGALTFTLNLVVGNTASAGGSGVRHNAPGTIASIDNDWWGCNQGPGFSPCDQASGPLGFGVTQWLTLSHTASPNTISTNQATTLQADFFTNNLGSSISAGDLVTLNGRAVTFNNAVLGAISGADATISGGKANATYTAGATAGSGSADATVDHATATASITINEAPVAPSVTTNPTNQTVCDGGTATFTAAASGVPAPTVQWQVSTGGSFTNISGATSTTLSFTATAADNGNQYQAVFTNASGTATTTAATLTVNTAPSITTNPANTTVCEGGTATFTAAASGSPAPTVQWQVSTGGPFANIPGATSTTLMFTATTADNGKQYRAVFTNSCSTATTTPATLTVNTNTSATTPADQTVCQGATASFSTTASGTGPFSYAWTVDGSPFGGNTSSINVPTGSLSVGNHPVSVTVTGACNSVVKNATLTVQAPTATSDPPDQTVCKGATATFSTTASGTGPFHYAWTLDGLPFNGDSATINVPTGSLSSGPHTVVVTTSGTCGSAMQTAILTVGFPPVITLSTATVSMWPPNHDYRTFNVSDFVASASGCDGDLTSSVVITSVSSDEAEDNPSGGDGTTLNDIVIAPDCKSVQLRQERDGNLNGRVYTITFKVADSQGNTTTATATVTVPVNNNDSAVNGPGPGYSVNSLCP
jgi:CSLREA domain-containing protein